MAGDATMKWDDFVLVDTIDFADGEDLGLLPPMEEHLILDDRRGDHLNNNNRKKKMKMSPPLDRDQDPKCKYLEDLCARLPYDTTPEGATCKMIVGPKEAFEYLLDVGPRVPYPPPKIEPGVPVPPPPGLWSRRARC